jgi:SAM-dependent methyltransferase
MCVPNVWRGDNAMNNLTRSETKLASPADDWDQHWTNFSASSDNSPTTRYRNRLCLRLLGIKGNGEGSKIVEIGSGTGIFARELLDRFPRAEYLGLELSETGVAAGKKQAPRGNFVQRNLLEPGDSSSMIRFNATHALCCEVLEHVDEPATLLRNAAAYFAPGCKIIVTVPGGWLHDFYRHIGHRRHYKPEELRQLLTSAGMRVDKVYGVGFPFFNIYQMLVKWRGKRLVQDAADGGSLLVRVGSAVFDALFRLNLMFWGWQTIGIAYYSDSANAYTAGAKS